MSTNESTSEQKRRSVESASATEPVETIESSEDSTIDVDEKFVRVLQSSHMISESIKDGCPSKKQNKMIKVIKSKMDQLYRDINTSKVVNTDNVVCLAQAYLHLFRIYANSIDDSQLNIAESHINKCVSLLEGKETERKVILTAVDVYYYLSHFYRKLNKYESSLITSTKILQLYVTYTTDKEYISPINVVSSFISDKQEDSEYLLEQNCIKVLQDLLAESGSPKADKTTGHTVIDKIAVSKYMLLKRLVNRISRLDYVKWVSHLMSLADILLRFEHFTEARDHLAAASFLMKEYYQEVYAKTDEKYPDKKISLFEVYQKTTTHIDMHWAKYGLKLMRSSHENLLRNVEDKPCTICKFEPSSVKKFEEWPNEAFTDVKICLNEFSAEMAGEYLTSYTDAKAVFATVLAHLKKALQYIVPECHLSQYVEIMHDTANAYKYLARYEQDAIKQAKLHKRRICTLMDINMLDIETDQNLFHPTWFEIAIAHSNVLDTNTEKFRYNNNKFNEELLNGTIESVENIIENWSLYLNHFS
ncbi:PREDICTED: KIF1-binding protein homolog [Dinoponera quadriceps]|uniref:KIF-binding protein n=1 Tax=Dinoponera quadriceps TaxID=609295 RepID=A0A6P3XA28_DINQU|nr:PREDICTED: KIF1-binding protein homolog [Dinoponera quadriceps]